MNLFRILPLVLTFCYCFQATAQTDSTKHKIIEGLKYDVLNWYVSYDKAKEMTAFISQKFISGGYDSTLNIDEFTYEVTMDLRKISHDSHINIIASHEETDSTRISKSTHRYPHYIRNKNGKIKADSFIITKLKRIKFKRYIRRCNTDKFTYGPIKILPGNIGYIEINDFNSELYNKKLNKDRISFKSVMSFLKNTNSIIIDLRKNTGGQEFLASYFSSFFSSQSKAYIITTESNLRFDTIPNDRPPSLKDLYTPKQNNFKFAKGKSIYILTSSATFSAPELTCYAIKKLNSNVSIVGEQTRGGANGHDGYHVTKYYAYTIPFDKVFDKDNNNYTWEAKGITPDILVDADSAFNVAYHSALKRTNKTSLRNKTKYFKGKTALQSPVHETISNPSDYFGNYRKVKILEKGNQLILIYDNFPKEVLIPKGNDNFTCDRFKYITFIRNYNNEVISIRIGTNEKYSETYRKL